MSKNQRLNYWRELTKALKLQITVCRSVNNCRAVLLFEFWNFVEFIGNERWITGDIITAITLPYCLATLQTHVVFLDFHYKFVKT